MLTRKSIFQDLIWSVSIFLLTYGSFAFFQNTPEHDGRWIPTKITLAKNVMGAWSFYKGPQAFAHNVLRLDAWSGFQEIVTNEQFSPTIVRFRFMLQKDSYIYVEYGKNNNEYYAFRLSVNSLFPSAALQVKSDGEFIQKKNFNSNLLPDTWYTATIHFDKKSRTAKLFINNTPPNASLAFVDNYGGLGFRGGMQPSSITDIALIDDTGKTIFSEKFYFWDSTIFFSLLFVCFALLCLLSAARIIYWRVARKNLLYVHVFQIAAIFIVGVVCVSQYYFMDKYPKTNGLFSYFWNAGEQNWKKAEVLKVSAALSTLESKTSYRILFIGSSQTWGAGAKTEKDTFVSQAERLTNSLALSDGKVQTDVLGADTGFLNQDQSSKIEFINAGVSGLNSGELLDLYKNFWKNQIKPDMVVINLSNNDGGDPTQFKTNLRDFIALNGSTIKTVLVLEANSPEQPPDQALSLRMNHDILKQLGEEYNLLVIDLHSYLISKNDSGILWWDKVHLTSFGQTLAAQLISNNLMTHIEASIH